VTLFLLGCAVIIDALIENLTVGHLIVGLLLVGVLPLDDLVAIIARRGRTNERTPPP
jgi:hypothetical protein